ncbi:hypothetical protein V8E55_002392 [Tylopilus felleus]
MLVAGYQASTPESRVSIRHPQDGHFVHERCLRQYCGPKMFIVMVTILDNQYEGHCQPDRFPQELSEYKETATRSLFWRPMFHGLICSLAPSGKHESAAFRASVRPEHVLTTCAARLTQGVVLLSLNWSPDSRIPPNVTVLPFLEQTGLLGEFWTIVHNRRHFREEVAFQDVRSGLAVLSIKVNVKGWLYAMAGFDEWPAVTELQKSAGANTVANIYSKTLTQGNQANNDVCRVELAPLTQ